VRLLESKSVIQEHYIIFYPYHLSSFPIPISVFYSYASTDSVSQFILSVSTSYFLSLSPFPFLYFHLPSFGFNERRPESFLFYSNSTSSLFLLLDSASMEKNERRKVEDGKKGRKEGGNLSTKTFLPTFSN